LTKLAHLLLAILAPGAVLAVEERRHPARTSKRR
jgi:hypothetical protein